MWNISHLGGSEWRPQSLICKVFVIIVKKYLSSLSKSICHHCQRVFVTTRVIPTFSDWSGPKYTAGLRQGVYTVYFILILYTVYNVGVLMVFCNVYIGT